MHKSIFDDVLEGVGAAADAIKLGPGLAPDTQMGPLVSSEQQERVLRYIESGKAEGASIVAGGEPIDHPGYYVKPTVMASVKNDMRVVQEEIFGPVLVAERFDDLSDVAAAANATPYRLIPMIKAGTVWVNCHGPVDPNMPFGGFKQSGIGRESGRQSIEMYTEVKSVCTMV